MFQLEINYTKSADTASIMTGLEGFKKNWIRKKKSGFNWSHKFPRVNAVYKYLFKSLFFNTSFKFRLKSLHSLSISSEGKGDFSLAIQINTDIKLVATVQKTSKKW